VELRLGTQGLWVQAENGGGGHLIGNQTSAGNYEKFKIHDVNNDGAIVDGDLIKLESYSGYFVSNDAGTINASDGFNREFEIDIISSGGGPYWAIPGYSPSDWNDYATLGEWGTQFNNRCYNYGANYATNTEAQVGRASGYTVGGTFFLFEIVAALISDGWEPASSPVSHPEGKMLVYLALEPTTPSSGMYVDWHFYRLDSTGTFSNKRGQEAVKNVDESTPTPLTITNPATCERGQYTEGIGYWYIPTFSTQKVGYANIL